MALPVAHAGHWLPYVIPGAIVLIAVVIASVRERRRQADQGPGGEGPHESPPDPGSGPDVGGDPGRS